MSKLSIVNEGSGRFIVDGDLTFSAMDKKTVSSFAFLTTTKQVTLDLGGVGNADSAGLALMIEWVKHARSKRVQLRFRNIPEQLLNLAKLSGVDKTSYFVSVTSG
ncbi:lipid asymmetry maintenance protein MlaB [Methyloglobulus sp.]|uniref:STAS domain-containing protein n=1 Tax=Methyloglobulus sp. TaxID=2518622 RepID=UPI003989704A